MSYLLPDLAIATDLTPFIQAYPWLSGGGFGTRYASPGSLPPTECVAASFSPSGKDIVTAAYASPWVLAYPWVTGSGNGWGTQYANPATLPATTTAGNYSIFSPSGDVVFNTYATNTNPGIIAYPWTTGAGNGFGTAYSNPGTSPGTFPQCSVFSNTQISASTDIVVSNTGSSPHAVGYPWTDGGGFGTIYSNPGTIPFNAIFAAFSRTGGDLALVSSFVSPYIQAYAWTVGSGWGTKYSDPGTAVPGGCRGIEFSPNNADLAVGQADSVASAIGAYAWSAGVGFGSKYADPATPPPTGAASYCVTFSRLGNDIVSVWNGTGSIYVSGYPWVSGTGFGAKYANPGTSLGTNANAVMFSPLARNNIGGPGILGALPSPALLAGMALTKAVMDNPSMSRRGLLGLRA